MMWFHSIVYTYVLNKTLKTFYTCTMRAFTVVIIFERVSCFSFYVCMCVCVCLSVICFKIFEAINYEK